MDKKFQKNLLEELYKKYPKFTTKWVEGHFMADQGLPDTEEQRRNIEYLKEKGFIIANPPGSNQFKITAEGIDYLEQLKKEIYREGTDDL